jgi:hypothetical protein
MIEERDEKSTLYEDLRTQDAVKLAKRPRSEMSVCCSCSESIGMEVSDSSNAASRKHISCINPKRF